MADLGIRPGKISDDAMIYFPSTAGAQQGLTNVVVLARGDASSLPATVARIAAEADPTLRLYDVMSLTDYYRVETIGYAFMLRALAVVSAVALLLSLAGVYALMSFTLSRRTREIGIRAALGAAPRRIVTTIFSRAFRQVAIGIAVGCVPGTCCYRTARPRWRAAAGPSWRWPRLPASWCSSHSRPRWHAPCPRDVRCASNRPRPYERSDGCSDVISRPSSAITASARRS